MATEFDPSDPNESLTHSTWYPLGADLTELILSHLPIRSIVLAAAACKPWRSLASSTSFSSRVSSSKKPWFFLYGLNNVFPKNNQAFAFDPDSHEWLRLPPSLVPSPSSQEQSFIGSAGFFLSTMPSSSTDSFRFSPILKSSWNHTSPLRFSRCNPVVAAFLDPVGDQRFIVVGGVRFIGGLVDIEDRLAVEIHNPNTDTWELCPPLPASFTPGNSSQSLSSALFKSKLYIHGIYSCFVSSFDLNNHTWSQVQTLRPPGVLSSFLIASQDQLVLAGLCNSPRGPSVIIWKVDEITMEFSEIGVMPQELLYCLFDREEDDRFASFKCLGLGNLIYVFNEEHHKRYPACVCEIRSRFDAYNNGCIWRKVPPLPMPVNSFHKVVSFCSTISLADILHSGD